MEWPADRPERRRVSSLRPFERNSRTHTPEQVAQVVASIGQWGWTNPVLIDPDGEIIAGHARVLAAQQLALEEIPVIVARGWSSEQKRAYVIADNKLSENSGWDADLLRLETAELKELGFDVALMGFGEGELRQLLSDGNFAPGSADDQGRLDQLAPKIVTCPHCQKAFDLRHVAEPTKA